MPRMSKSGNKSKKGGLRVFWIPTGSHNKHKKNKYYVRDNFKSTPPPPPPESAMMSGDSPNTHSKDYYNFKEGRPPTTPPPTTSKDIVIQNCGAGTDVKADIFTASVLVEPVKEHGPGTNYNGIIDGHVDHKNDDEILVTEDRPLKGDDLIDGDSKEETRKLNGLTTMLDGHWTAPPEVKKTNAVNEDDDCPVKCLYYTLQCCECSLM